MRKLTLSDWSNIAEIATSIVIVISLIYVVIELNHNTRAMQNESYQNMLNALVAGDLALASDAELNAIVETSERDPEKLTPLEWSRFSRYAYTRVGAWEYNFLAHRDNAVSETQWSGFEPYFLGLICLPGYQRWWEENKSNFAPDFAAYLKSDALDICPKAE